MRNAVDRARFLAVFAVYVHREEWVTADQLAARILPRYSRDFAKEVARKLSNLNRFGHLERRRIESPKVRHEYRRAQPVRLPAEMAPTFQFIVAGRPEKRPPPVDL